MTFDDWCKTHGLFLNDPDDAAVAARTMAFAAWERSAAVERARFKFAGYFTEIPSAMSYRLWEQGGADPEPGYVALYEG